MQPEKTPPTTGLYDPQRRYQKSAAGKMTQRRWRESPAGVAWWAEYRAAHLGEARATLRRYLAVQKPLTDALTAALTALNSVNTARVGIRPSKANATLASELAGAAAALRDLITTARNRT